MTPTLILETVLVATLMVIHDGPNEAHAESIQASEVDESGGEATVGVGEVNDAVSGGEASDGARPYGRGEVIELPRGVPAE